MHKQVTVFVVLWSDADSNADWYCSTTFRGAFRDGAMYAASSVGAETCNTFGLYAVVTDFDNVYAFGDAFTDTDVQWDRIALEHGQLLGEWARFGSSGRLVWRGSAATFGTGPVF